MASPAFQAAMSRTSKNDGWIFMELFVNIDQRRRGGDAVGNAKAKPVSLTMIVIPKIKS